MVQRPGNSTEVLSSEWRGTGDWHLLRQVVSGGDGKETLGPGARQLCVEHGRLGEGPASGWGHEPGNQMLKAKASQPTQLGLHREGGISAALVYVIIVGPAFIGK